MEQRNSRGRRIPGSQGEGGPYAPASLKAKTVFTMPSDSLESPGIFTFGLVRDAYSLLPYYNNIKMASPVDIRFWTGSPRDELETLLRAIIGPDPFCGANEPKNALQQRRSAACVLRMRRTSPERVPAQALDCRLEAKRRRTWNRANPYGNTPMRRKGKKIGK